MDFDQCSKVCNINPIKASVYIFVSSARVNFRKEFVNRVWKSCEIIHESMCSCNPFKTIKWKVSHKYVENINSKTHDVL